MDAKKEISKAKAMLVCLETLQNTKEAMLNNGVEYEVIENFDEIIRTEIKRLGIIVDFLGRGYEKCTCDGEDSGCSSECCDYKYKDLPSFKNSQPKKSIEIRSDRPKKDIYHTSIGDVCGSDEIINTFEKYKDE